MTLNALFVRFARKGVGLGQPEVAAGMLPAARNPSHILSSAAARSKSSSAAMTSTAIAAERYGYLNRALPGVDLGGFVDAFARRVASFARRAITAAKNLIDQVPLASADRLLDALNSSQTALT